MFAQPTGKPIDPRADYREWRELLDAAEVRAARLHDARHTAATMLVVLRVPVRALMDIMGWSEASMASRYMHVPDELEREIAGQIAGLLWASPAAAPDGLAADERTDLTDDQRPRLCSSRRPYRRTGDTVSRGCQTKTATPPRCLHRPLLAARNGGN